MAAYEAGLAGADCWLRGDDGTRRPLPLDRWIAEADHRDRHLLDATLAGLPVGGSVLDVGCGPGRLTAALARVGRARGIRALGIDTSDAAVALAHARGAPAHRIDVFAALPARWHHSWQRVLLADGNIGIGGDPATLLGRLEPLLAPGGLILADVRKAGSIVRGPAWIEAVEPGGQQVGGPVPWAWVGADAVAGLGRQVGLRLRDLIERPGGLIAVWER